MSRRDSDPAVPDDGLDFEEPAAPADEGGDDAGTLRVVVRLRPFHAAEIGSENAVPPIQCAADGQTLELAGVKPGEPKRCFTFNAMLGPDASQADVYERSGVRPLLARALSGYACTVFAFGQTGSGKTHTITGYSASPDGLPSGGDGEGLMPRALRELAAAASELRGRGKVTLSASYIEVYNEQVLDLLNPHSGRGALPVRWKTSRGFYVENLFVVECQSDDDLLAVMEEGTRYRHIAAHDMNERSSRSHAILTVNIDREYSEDDDLDAARGPGLLTAKRLHGSIAFVDLAGSERVKVTKSLLVESNNINQSLLTLGNCISALGDPKKRNGHIPYRDSALTMLLKDSLGGTGLTLMIACISPATPSLHETHNTLRYANRAKRIRNKPVVHMDPQQQLIQALKREVQALRAEVSYLRGQTDPSHVAAAAAAGAAVGPAGSIPGSGPATRPRLGGKGPSTGSLASAGDADMQSFAQELMQTRLMLHQYMEDNEALRSENVQLYSQNDLMQRQYEDAINENALLLRVRQVPASLVGAADDRGLGPRSWAPMARSMRGPGSGGQGGPKPAGARPMPPLPQSKPSSGDARRLQFDKSDTTLFREIASGAFEDQLARHLEGDDEMFDGDSSLRSSLTSGAYAASLASTHAKTSSNGKFAAMTGSANSSSSSSHRGGHASASLPLARTVGGLPPLSPRTGHSGGGYASGHQYGSAGSGVAAAVGGSGSARDQPGYGDERASSLLRRPNGYSPAATVTAQQKPAPRPSPAASKKVSGYSNSSGGSSKKSATTPPAGAMAALSTPSPPARAGAVPEAAVSPTTTGRRVGGQSLGSMNMALRRELDELEVELIEAQREVSLAHSAAHAALAAGRPAASVPAAEIPRKRSKKGVSSGAKLDWTVP